jgi:hypothetical protein
MNTALICIAVLAACAGGWCAAEADQRTCRPFGLGALALGMGAVFLAYQIKF